MLQEGATGADVGIVALVLMAALLMAATPFAVVKARSFGGKLLYALFGIALAVVNYAMAVESVGNLRDSGAGPARDLVHKAAGLDSRIERARNSRKLLPQAPPAVTAAMEKAAQGAVDSVEAARQQECGKVGDNCRIRVAEKAKAIDTQADLLARKATYDAATKLDSEIARLESERAALGPIPENIDPHAARLAKQVGRFVKLGDNPVQEVADAVISIVSAFAEVIGLLGPIVLMTAMGGSPAPSEPAQRRRWFAWFRFVQRKPTPPVVATKPMADAAVGATAATPAKAKTPKKIKGAGVREFGSVREWKESRTVARAGGRTKPADAHAAYKGWCVEQGLEPVSLTAFGLTMKGDLGVIYEEKNKRGHYIGIVVVSGPRLAVSN